MGKEKTKRIRGFTLVELLIVVAIIAIVAVIIFVLLKPLSRFQQARNTKRTQDITAVAEAVRMYQINNSGQIPAGITQNWQMLGTDTSGCKVACASIGSGGTTQTLSNNFDNAVEYTTSNPALIQVSASMAQLVNLGGGTYSIAMPYVYQSLPAALTDPISLGALSYTPGAGNQGGVEFSLNYNGADQWWNGSAWVSNSGQMQAGSGLWGDAVAVWHLNEGSGSLIDSKGTNNATAGAGVVYGVTGKLNTALQFNGAANVNAQAAMANPLPSTATFSFWATWNGTQGQMLFLAGPYYTGVGVAGPDLYFSNNIISWNTWNGVGNPFGAIPATANNGQYHHYVIVAAPGAGNTKLYYDGVLLGTAPNYVSPSGSNFVFGGAGLGYNWGGKVDEFILFNRALTADEVRKLYAQQNNNRQTNSLSQINSGLPSLVVNNGDRVAPVSYLISNGTQRAELDNVDLTYNQAGSGGLLNDHCLDLSTALSRELPKVPYDPTVGSANKTYYAIRQLPNEAVSLISCGAEGGETITITR